MVTVDDLKQIVMLTYLTDSMLASLSEIVDVLKFEKNEVIFIENEAAMRFYMLRSGSVLLEQEIAEDVTACVGSIKPGYSFGWSAMVEEASYYTTHAICVEDAEVLSVRREKIRMLFERDPEMGFRFYQRLLLIIKKWLDYRSVQFRQAIVNHPDMQKLFCS